MAAVWGSGTPFFPYEQGLKVMIPAIAGAAVGATAQWLILLRRPAPLGEWVLIAAVSWALGLSVLVLLPIDFPIPNFGPRELLAGAVYGATSLALLASRTSTAPPPNDA